MTNRKITFEGLVTIYWRDRWLIAGLVFFCVAISVFYALSRKPIFQSEALLAPAKEQPGQFGALSAVAGQLAGLGALAGISGMQGGDIDEAVAVLKSRQFTDAFLQKNEVLPHLFPELWDTKNSRWKLEDSDNDRVEAKVQTSPDNVATKLGEQEVTPSIESGRPSGEKAYLRFEKMRDVTVDRRTNYVRLTMRASTPELANKWAAAMITDLNETMRRAALEEARLSVTTLAKKMESEQIESIRVTSAKLLESQLQRQIIAEIRKEFALRVIDAPTLPEQRIYPRRTRMVMIGFAFGLIFGCVFVLGRRAWLGRSQGP